MSMQAMNAEAIFHEEEAKRYRATAALSGHAVTQQAARSYAEHHAQKAREVRYAMASLKWGLCVDGCVYDDPESPLQGDGQFPPFYVFDIDAQDNVAGPLPTREAAERVMHLILKSGVMQ